MRFAFFGMGPRPKLLYRGGQLLEALTGEVLREWPVAREDYDLVEYRVTLELADGRRVVIEEDEEAVWLREGEEACSLGTGRVSLPRFEPHPHAALLRRLHAELLVNIVPAGPVPNLLVYARPWYRDAAMVALCLERTGNLHLLHGWLQGLQEPFDCNNGNEEPDNLGQYLYLLSLLTRGPEPVMALPELAKQPRVQAALAAAERCRCGEHLTGLTDGGEHPVYQTKWLKFGLRALGLPDPWVIPQVYDSYSSLFWMDYREQHVPGPRFAAEGPAPYPYLAWAEAHFLNAPPPLLTPPQSPSAVPPAAGVVPAADAFPLTWEAQASQADYSRLAVISPEYAAAHLAVPHTWHAAEMFLYLGSHHPSW